MNQAANSNFPPATAGGAFHPEMGERQGPVRRPDRPRRLLSVLVDRAAR